MKEYMESNFYVETDALKFLENKLVPVKSRVAKEVTLQIMVNDIELTTLLMSPSDIKELVFGYLFTEGFIKKPEEVKNFVCDTKQWVASVELSQKHNPEFLHFPGTNKSTIYNNIHKFELRTPCTSSVVVSANAIISASEWISQISIVFRETGGVHLASLFDIEKGVQYYFEDIARHNSVDKVIGKAFMDSREMDKMMLVRSGRTSSEILLKARRANIPIIICRGAPTHHAVCLAKEIGITLICFARNKEFTIYANEQRVENAVQESI